MYNLDSFVRDVAGTFVVIDDNFMVTAKRLNKLTKVAKHNSKLIVLTNLALLCLGGIVYIQDKQISKLEKDVEQLKSGEAETKAE